MAGSHSAPASSGRSLRRGLMQTNRQPRAAASRIASRSTWRLMPPLATREFFNAMPPKASTTSVCPTICSQVTLRRATSSIVPITWGRMTADAPAL
jgi:hypothetical protein